MEPSTIGVLGSSALASALYQALKPGIAYSPWVDKILALAIGGVIGYLETRTVDGAVLGALAMVTTHSMVLNKTALGKKLDDMNITSLLGKPSAPTPPTIPATSTATSTATSSDFVAKAPAEALGIVNLILNPATRAAGKEALAEYDRLYGAFAGGGLKALISAEVRAMAA